MKKFLSQFFLRGLLAAAGGPVVLAIVYGILGATGTVNSFAPSEVVLGILTVTLLALIVGGCTAIYQIDRLPLGSAIAIHGGILYCAYILIYLLNGWLQRQLIPVLIFTAIFIAGYALIWRIIYRVTKAKTDKINQNLPSNR